MPRLVLVSHDLPSRELLAEALCLASRPAARSKISRPSRGEKAELVRHAMVNAREALGRKMAESSAQSTLLNGVCEAFGLEARPDRIEVYDNAHIMGSNAVGGMIVAGPDGFQKSQYRKFNIKNTELTPGDDYGMMREGAATAASPAWSRRRRPATQPAPPSDLVLIDGGAGQLAVVTEVMAGFSGVDDIMVVGVAKGTGPATPGWEQFFIPGKEPFMLEPKSPVLYYLQRLRDEAHRFANGAHRTRRSMDLKKNPLDEIEGVGPGRKRALLHAFGSARGVSKAAPADLMKVEGVSASLAQRIHDYFNKGSA